MTFDTLPPGVKFIKTYLSSGSLLSCTHDPGYRREHDGSPSVCCRICKGDEQTTHGYAWPVMMLVDSLNPLALRGLAPAIEGQEALF